MKNILIQTTYGLSMWVDQNHRYSLIRTFRAFSVWDMLGKSQAFAAENWSRAFSDNRPCKAIRGK